MLFLLCHTPFLESSLPCTLLFSLFLKQLSALSDFTYYLYSIHLMYLSRFFWPLLPPRFSAACSVENSYMQSCLLTYCLLGIPQDKDWALAWPWSHFPRKESQLFQCQDLSWLDPQRLWLLPPLRTQMQSWVALTALKGCVAQLGGRRWRVG